MALENLALRQQWAGVETPFVPEISIPSFSNSPWMRGGPRGAPHSGLAAAIFLTKARISGLLAWGRTLRFLLEIQVQKRRKPLPMPGDYGLGFYDDQHLGPVLPALGEQNPKETVRLS
jgi:hypothetical protein